MLAAARLYDGIEHTGALAGLVLGAVAGVALVTAVAFTFATGGLGGFLIAMAAGVAGSSLAAAGESLGSLCSSAAGVIESGSPDIFINGRPAAHVEHSIALCDQHPPTVQVAEGSPTVLINGQAAARKGDRLSCGARIAGGSSNTFIGGGTRTYLPITDEVPAWLRYSTDILMGIAGGASVVRSVFKRGLQQGIKAALPCAGRFLAGVLAGDALVRFGLAPLASRVLGGQFGHPVDTTTGRKLLPEETDFVLPGLMPIEWSRFYASDIAAVGALGRGWVLPWEQSLSRCGSFLYLSDSQGRSVPFVTLEPNQRIFNPHEQLYLVRTAGGRYLLQTLDDVFFHFGEVPDDDVPVPLQRIENAQGHYLHFTRHADGRLTDLTATGGQRVHLHYDHPLGRLTEVRRIDGDRAVETLVQYRYDAAGHLLDVVNRNGDLVRRFGYGDDGRMIRHDNGLGLSCHYRYAVLGGQPRVVEHWTSDGERFHFHYDLAARTTTVTDVLGRQAQVHYDAGHRVVASTDLDGERYAIDLDPYGNLTGLTLPDGNRLTLAYDEHGRLTEETDPLGRSTRYRYHFLSTRVRQVDYPDGTCRVADYDNQGHLIGEIDPLGQATEYLNSPDGLPHTIINAHHQRTHLWWNACAQVVRYQDCSGHATVYGYNERDQLTAITDAQGHTTTFERNATGDVLRLHHPDGSHETFTYNVHGQLLSHANGKGQLTRLQRNARGLPIGRQAPSGQRTEYTYDAAQRLSALINENNAAYRFCYDASDRLIEEQRIDRLTRRFRYTLGGQLAELTEIGHGEQGERPERSTTFERDTLGRLQARVTDDARLAYTYDSADRVVAIARTPTACGKRRGVSEETLGFAYDPLGRLTRESSPQGTLSYDYDALHNLTTLGLPGGQQLNHLYYGSGHLHQLNLDGQVISDVQRDTLHREVYRTQGRLTSCFGHDALGRRAWQFASTLPADKLAGVLGDASLSLLVDHPYNPIHRRYTYDRAGELTRVLDNLRGETRYLHDARGQLLGRETGHPLDSEAFRYDAAANRLDYTAPVFAQVNDNRLAHWRDQTYRYDPWGNLIEKRSGHTQLQHFTYDCENRLVRADTWRNGQHHSTGRYQYDSLGRRVAKHSERGGHTASTRFLWQGLRLLREDTPTASRLYLYEPDSYAPLARVDQVEGEAQQVYYFHTDVIGTPLELTNADGEIVWQARYRCWGEIDALTVNTVEQHLRFQGQYFDAETGLHYNTFRYYDPEVGRFTTQDPIGLLGGDNLYQYVPSPVGWVDPWGWSACGPNKKTSYEGVSRRDAFRQAKRDAGIPNGQSPSISKPYLEDGYGKPILGKYGLPIETRQYHYVNRKGEKVIIQEHSLGHSKATPSHGAEPHFNVRPWNNTKTGDVSGTHGHYNFPWRHK
ncbi:RHS repeat-associated core domain-containing protein [Pseudomonas japonica]|uniref:RHS repeat-associated core domain-containing protein n=1 Tax=Pseudomonas japonica TaxID=256466 RepID=UPI0015E34347|nr:RHS repeat-associated core domain-containing protein [Pseudomonas japonica]MBA1245047.1 type IV secretion protein Rhs [Pseudomonas japonica]